MPRKSLQSSSTTVETDFDPQRELLDSLASLLKEPKYSDLTITCHSHSFPVHRCIVGPRSEFFARSCDGEFQEAVSREIKLNDEPLLVKKMIEYLYTLDYKVDEVQSLEVETPANADTRPAIKTSDLPSSIASTQYFNPLSIHILMYSLADRLFIHGLKSLSKVNVKKGLNQLLDSDAFRLAVIEIYNTTPEHERALRDLVVEITVDRLPLLREKNDSNSAVLQDSLFKEIPEYAYDLLRAMIKKDVKSKQRLGRY